MTAQDRLEAWLGLLDAGLPPAPVNRLLAAFGSPEDALGASDSAWLASAGLTPPQCVRLRDSSRDGVRRRRQLEVFHELDMRLVERGRRGYPLRLTEMGEDGPPALFSMGDVRDEDRLAVALVGPRLATPYGLEIARRLAVGFAPLMTVVSGLAAGIDSTAHQAALDAGGRTLGLAACGLDQDYPKGSAPLRERIPGAGALLSAYPPLTRPARHFFPARNHLMAGLSLAVVVVEASEKSGALATARAAADLGRDVHAVPGDITRRNSRGSNALIQEGAGLVTCAADVLADLEGRLDEELSRLRAERLAKAPEPAPAPDPGALAPKLATVLEVLRHAPRQYNELVAELVPGRMSVGELAGALLQLEIRGLARQLPGKTYAAAF